MVGREDKRTNSPTMSPALKNNAAAGYQGTVKRELLKGAGLLITNSENDQLPVGLIAQLEEHCTGIAEVMGSIAVQA